MRIYLGASFPSCWLAEGNGLSPSGSKGCSCTFCIHCSSPSRISCPPHRHYSWYSSSRPSINICIPHVSIMFCFLSRAPSSMEACKIYPLCCSHAATLSYPSSCSCPKGIVELSLCRRLHPPYLRLLLVIYTKPRRSAWKGWNPLRLPFLSAWTSAWLPWTGQYACPPCWCLTWLHEASPQALVPCPHFHSLGYVLLWNTHAWGFWIGK